MAKYIFVTGGVVSSLGKGITASAIGQLLKSRGLKVFMQKFDPYLNVDPGTMSPYQHGEVYVTADGAETDLDLGHYERFIDENLNKHSSITAGKIYQKVLDKERRGDYEGKTVQVIPHVTNQIKKKLVDVVKDPNIDVVITEIGGTVGDFESLPFLEAIRQARRDFGYENTLYVHNTLLPYLKAAKEIKTKPTQHSVKELRSLGIQPDIIVLRSEYEIEDSVKDKIALFCDVDKEAVFTALDVDVIYEIIGHLKKQNIDNYILKHFKYVHTQEADIKPWDDLVYKIKHLKNVTTIGLVGKYVSLHDAYLSVSEALKHAGYANNTKIEIKWINSEYVNDSNVSDKLKGCDAVLVPGGFGERGIKGKISAIKYAREQNIPFFGICLGMQVAVIEYARTIAALSGANSSEINPATAHPVIDLLPEQKDIEDLGGTMRLGLYPCKLAPDSLAMKCYQDDLVHERHRHRYEFNNEFREPLESMGLRVSGTSPDGRLVEIIELPGHPWFLAVQFHPEFTSRPNRPQPLFKHFVEAAMQIKH